MPVLATVGGKLATVQHDPNPDPVETAKAHAGGPAWKAPRKKMRWGDKPHCPRCGSVEVARKNDGYRKGKRFLTPLPVGRGTGQGNLALSDISL